MCFQYPSLVTLSSFIVSFSSSSIVPDRCFIKCFHSQLTGSRVFLNLSSISRLDSRSLVLRCIRDALVCLFMFPLSPLFPFHVLSSVHSNFSFFLSWSSFFFLPSLSSSVSFSSLFPSYRAHNCIIERLFSQLALFPLCLHSVTFLTFLVSMRTHVDPETESYYLFISTAEWNEENNVRKHQGWVIR